MVNVAGLEGTRYRARVLDFWNVIDAVGSFGGMLLAGIAGWVAYRLFKVESLRDQKAEEFRREQAEEKKQDQAAKVGLWYDIDAGKMVVLNASSLPIYAVEAHCLINDAASLPE